MSEHTCEWKNYKTLIQRYNDAIAIGNAEQANEIRAEIYSLARSCGAIPMRELMEILDIQGKSKHDFVVDTINVVRCSNCNDCKQHQRINIPHGFSEMLDRITWSEQA